MTKRDYLIGVCLVIPATYLVDDSCWSRVGITTAASTFKMVSTGYIPCEKIENPDTTTPLCKLYVKNRLLGVFYLLVFPSIF